MGPWDALGIFLSELVLGLKREKKIEQWARQLFDWAALILGMMISYAIGFSVAAGGALVAGKGYAIALGLGLVSGAAMSFAAFIRSPLGKRIVVAVPQRTLDASLDEKGRGAMISSPRTEEK